MARLGDEMKRIAFHVCLLAYPREFRERTGEALEETFRDQVRRAGERGRLQGVLTTVAECANLVTTGMQWRWSFRRAPRAPRAPRARVRRVEWGGAMLHDVRYALRSFRKEPAFALGAVALLALGIGANTAMFSLFEAYLLRPLPFADSERLVSVRPVARDAPRSVRDTVPRDLDNVRWPARDALIEEAVTWDLDVFTLVDADEPEVVSGAWVPPSYFRALGTRAALGRLFDERDGEPGAPPVAVLSHELWVRRFGASPNVLGQTLSSFSSDRPEDAEVFTIVGVLPPGFWFINRYTEIFTNLTAPQMPYVLRLAPGITHEQAEAHLTGFVRAQLDGIDPAWPGMSVTSLHAAYVRSTRSVLLVLAASVGFVLLIACGNVALLLTVRALGRQREIQVRRALGASAFRIARQLGVEGLLLAGSAGALGVVLASWALAALAPLVQSQLPAAVPGGIDQVGIHAPVLLMALGLCVAIGIVFALAPAMFYGGSNLASGLREAGQGSSDSGKRRLARNVVIAGEVGLSLVLLVGATLMLRSVLHLQRLELGFDPERVLSAYVSLRQRDYAEPSRLTDLTSRYLERLRGTPGVVAASVVGRSRPFGTRHPTSVAAEGEEANVTATVTAALYAVSDGYFETLSTPISAGRSFLASDRADAAPVAIVSETLARTLWPSAGAGALTIGRRLRLDAEGPDAPWRSVVGITRDVRESVIEEELPDVYVPFAQSPSVYPFVVVKAAGDVQAVVPAVRKLVWEIDPTAAVTQFELMTDRVAGESLRPRFLAGSLTAFSLFAAALAAAGLYAIVAYAVRQRRRDVAIHMALGADDRSVVAMFLYEAGWVIGAGIAVGVLASLALTRSLATQLHGVTTLDAPAYLAAISLLVFAAALAVWLPARRATETDPMRVLRQE